MSDATVEQSLVHSRWLLPKEADSLTRVFLYDSLGNLLTGADEDEQAAGRFYADLREEMFLRSGGSHRSAKKLPEPTYLPDDFIRAEDAATWSPPSLNCLIPLTSSPPAPHLYPPPSLRSPHYANAAEDDIVFDRNGRDFWLQWSHVDPETDVNRFASDGLSFAVPSRQAKLLRLLAGGLCSPKTANGPSAVPVNTGELGAPPACIYPTIENFNNFPFHKVMRPHGMQWKDYAPTIGRSWHGGRTSVRFKKVKRRVVWTAVLGDPDLVSRIDSASLYANRHRRDRR